MSGMNPPLLDEQFDESDEPQGSRVNARLERRKLAESGGQPPGASRLKFK
jgi:hypothetical protein